MRRVKAVQYFSAQFCGNVQYLFIHQDVLHCVQFVCEWPEGFSVLLHLASFLREAVADHVVQVGT